MSQNIIISQIEIDNSYNIVFLSIKEFPGFNDLIGVVKDRVLANKEKYTTM